MRSILFRSHCMYRVSCFVYCILYSTEYSAHSPTFVLSCSSALVSDSYLRCAISAPSSVFASACVDTIYLNPDTYVVVVVVGGPYACTIVIVLSILSLLLLFGCFNASIPGFPEICCDFSRYSWISPESRARPAITKQQCAHFVHGRLVAPSNFHV